MPMATKLGRVGIQNEEIPSTKLQGFLTTSRGLARSREILNLLSLLAYGHKTWQDGDLLQEASTNKVTQPFKCGHVRSQDKLKTLYLHCHNAYGHQNWQGSYTQ